MEGLWVFTACRPAASDGNPFLCSSKGFVASWHKRSTKPYDRTPRESDRQNERHNVEIPSYTALGKNQRSPYCSSFKLERVLKSFRPSQADLGD
jgi:hypothetical protein